jgi:hypothetical protein
MGKIVVINIITESGASNLWRKYLNISNNSNLESSGETAAFILHWIE